MNVPPPPPGPGFLSMALSTASDRVKEKNNKKFFLIYRKKKICLN